MSEKSRIRFLLTLLTLDEPSRQHLLSNEPPEEIVELTVLASKLVGSLRTAGSSPSFRELAHRHDLRQSSEEQYLRNVRSIQLAFGKDIL